MLRRQRQRQGRTLREVSSSARVSLGYLSEVERGRKEASSELLAAICDALELPLSQLMRNVASDLSVLDSVPDGADSPERAEALERRGESASRASVDGVEGGRLVPAVVGDNLADLRIQPVLSHRMEASLNGRRIGAVVAA